MPALRRPTMRRPRHLRIQHVRLAALDLHLTPQQRRQAECAAGDGIISLEDFTQKLQALLRGKSPGFDGLPYESQRFWDQLGPEGFQPCGPASLAADMTEGGVTLLYKGQRRKQGAASQLPAHHAAQNGILRH